MSIKWTELDAEIDATLKALSRLKAKADTMRQPVSGPCPEVAIVNNQTYFCQRRDPHGETGNQWHESMHGYCTVRWTA